MAIPVDYFEWTIHRANIELFYSEILILARNSCPDHPNSSSPR